MKKNVCLNIKIFSLILLGILTSCEKEHQEGFETEQVSIKTEDRQKTELAFPNTTGSIEKISFQGSEVLVENIDGTYVLEGDILLTKAQVNVDGLSKKSTGRLDGKWPNNQVFFRIDPALPNQRRVTDAIAHWEANTNLRFIQRTNQNDFINFQSGTGCSSFVGRIGGQQNITLATGCSTGSTIHEIGHAIGLYHEQSREDRDDYIIINTNNIRSGREHNFQSWRERGAYGTDLTPTLDFGSIMMYSSTAFSKNGQPTITRLDGNTYTTQRTGLSEGDIAGVELLYPLGNSSTWWFGNTEGDPSFYRDGDTIHEMQNGEVKFTFKIWNDASNAIYANDFSRSMNILLPKTSLGNFGSAYLWSHKDRKWIFWKKYTYIDN